MSSFLELFRVFASKVVKCIAIHCDPTLYDHHLKGIMRS